MTSPLIRARRLLEGGHYARALSACEDALAQDRWSAEGYTLLGAIAIKLERPGLAVDALTIATKLDALNPAAFTNLVAAHYETDDLSAALAAAEAGLRTFPNCAPLHFNYGIVLFNLDRWSAAVAAYMTAIRLDPNHIGAHARLVDTLRQLGRLHEAEAIARRGLTLDADAAPIHAALALVLLSQGRFTEGWVEHEWRWHMPRLIGPRQHPYKPQWDGSPLVGRTLLLHAEQGFGDTLQFCRYARRISGAERILFQVPSALVRLVSTLGHDCVADGDAVPRFDVHCPMMSLPLVCGTRDPALIPDEVPYLAADAAETGRWAARLAALPGIRVGLCWAGGRRLLRTARLIDRRRSIPLEAFRLLATTPGLSLVSLQKGDAAIAESAAGAIPLVDWTEDLPDFAATAALVSALDLVITVDTAVAHLAGALGRPVWLLNRFDTDWRWSRAGASSPWYPTMRIFRQPTPGDWTKPIVDVISALHEHIRSNQPFENAAPCAATHCR